MIIDDWDKFAERIPEGGSRATAKPKAATIGVFDGLHLGHKALMERVLSYSPEFETCAFTFRENPKETTSPARVPGRLFSSAQKLECFEAAGFDRVVLIDFSPVFSTMSGMEFVSALCGAGVRAFVIGADFKCGYRLSMHAEGLSTFAAKLDARTEIVEPLFHEGEAISSSRIRNVIAEGRLEKAFAMLGRPYSVDVRDMPRESLAGTIRYDFSGSGAVLPPPGDYEGILVSEFPPARGDGESVRELVVETGRYVIVKGASESATSCISFVFAKKSAKQEE